jgi:3,4-dihydroxy 2-butanone 4-phosphate synthase/GTP cyclohydrolase II
MTSSAIPDAIADFAAGRMVVITDDESRENEGDVCVAAELVTAEDITFMAHRASGLVCVAMDGERLDDLGLHQAVEVNTSPHATAFTVWVDAAGVTTTGISAHDRAVTIRRLVDPMASAADFVVPGHVFPLRAAPGGVLERKGHTEAAVDLSRLAGCRPGGVICEVLNDDGTMARGRELEDFADRHGLRMITIDELAAYRRRTETLVVPRASCRMPLGGVDWQAHVYEDLLAEQPLLALVLGEVGPSRPALVHLHARCTPGDVFGDRRCGCGAEVRAAIQAISDAGSGVILYFGPRGGLVEELGEGGPAGFGSGPSHQRLSSRDRAAGCQVLSELGVGAVRLLAGHSGTGLDLGCEQIGLMERIPLPQGVPEEAR